jgi:hypothetical protein
MDSVAKQSPIDRAALFNETGATRGLANAIVEKDFWVCWTLKRLFALPKESIPGLVFKGGTSLSKVYGAIRRFSEDIDLSFDRSEFGYVGDRDPERVSKKAARGLIEELVKTSQDHIAAILIPKLLETITAELGPPGETSWLLAIDDGDPQTVNFLYPLSLPKSAYGGLAYISPRVRLEFGARGDPWPSESRRIRPYSAEDFPNWFTEPWLEVNVLAAERTFWEKATALHAEHHRPADSPTPRYFSRHYYDIALLADTSHGKTAIADLKLLQQVARHKTLFFRSGWANYDAARPGSLRLLPTEERIKDLRVDYRQMAPMIFDDPAPPFDGILKRIERLEKEINEGH